MYTVLVVALFVLSYPSHIYLSLVSIDIHNFASATLELVCAHFLLASFCKI